MGRGQLKYSRRGRGRGRGSSASTPSNASTHSAAAARADLGSNAHRYDIDSEDSGEPIYDLETQLHAVRQPARADAIIREEPDEDNAPLTLVITGCSRR